MNIRSTSSLNNDIIINDIIYATKLLFNARKLDTNFQRGPTN